MRKYLSLLLIVLMCACQNGYNRYGSDAEDLDVNVGDSVLFDVNSARLDDQAQNVLARQANWLNDNREIKVIIEGHCDERGTREYNLALGAKRANAVKEYLIASGVNPSRVSTISYGKERPPVPGTGQDVWRENRRAVTRTNCAAQHNRPEEF